MRADTGVFQPAGFHAASFSFKTLPFATPQSEFVALVALNLVARM
jgi:hypothetical protein